MDNICIVYESISGNTRSFAKRLGLPSYELNPNNVYDFNPNQKFIFICPTYVRESLNVSDDFLEVNHENCLGIIASGNKNFADLYIFTAIDFCKDYDLELLYDFELRGNKKDIENVLKIYEELSDK